MKSAFLTILSLLVISSSLFAYPPDNAAVLYYKLMEEFEKPDNTVWDQIDLLSTSNQPASKEVIAYIEKQNQIYLIPELKVASEVKHCDWGLNMEHGFGLMMPGLSKMKQFTYLLLAEGAIQANDGDMAGAIDNNLVVRRMAHHRSNDTLISFLVAYSMVKRSDEALYHLLATHTLDPPVIVDLKRELLRAPYRPLSVREPLLVGERNVAIMEIPGLNVEKLKKIGNLSEIELKRAERIFENPNFAEGSVEYIEQYYDRIVALIDKPYAETITGLQKESQRVVDDADKGNDDAFIPSIFIPALAKCYNYNARWQTDYHALLTALDIYIIVAKSGKLPETLPQSAYPDAFSGKPFIYETTENGFLLRCQQEDLIDKKVKEYHCKLPDSR